MKVCFDHLPQESAGLLALDNDFGPDNSLLLDIYAFEDASIDIQIKEAESQEIHISKLQIITYNFNALHFVPNKYKVLVDQLEITCPGVHIVADGLNIDQCEISTTRPQICLENFRAKVLKARCIVDDNEEQIRKLLPGVTIIPACGEYVLDPDLSLLNEAFNSLDKLKRDLPSVKCISPVVAWFASSLNIGQCKIKPGIDRNYWHPNPDSWKVKEYTKDGIADNAPMVINQVDGNSIYGGTINDDSVTKYLEHAHELGFKIIFYPLIMVNQDNKPWRGWIGKDEEVTIEDVERFYDKEYKPFIEHYAKLAKDKVDAFIIGSELIGLTSLKTDDNQFLFVKKLIELASVVREILGPDVKISYAADWSEYHSVSGGMRPLDELWADKNIDFVGIDAYFPLTHSEDSRFSLEELMKGCESGEGYNFYFEKDRKIEFKESEPWNQWKNLPYWWNSDHEVEGVKTSWKARMKPIWFTEFGFPSIDKAPNKPNVFYNPECHDGGKPTFSNGKTDYAVQLFAIRAMLEYWQNATLKYSQDYQEDPKFIENMICWTWDARGENWMNCSYYADGSLWRYGHWIDGKIGAPREEVAIKGNNIDIKQLVVSATKVKFDQANIIIRDIAALSGDSLTISDSRISAGRLFASFKGDVKITPHICEEYKETKRDSGKTVITTEISYVTQQIIEVEEAVIIAGKSLIIDHATLKIKYLQIKASNIDSTAAITTNCRTEKFTGGVDFWGESRNHEKDEVIQTAHLIQIISDTLKIDVDNLFKAAGTRIIASELDTEAKDYHFTGLFLHHSVMVSGNEKGAMLFGGPERYGSNHSHQDIEGVEVLVAGCAYVIAEGKIWLQASQINADEVTMKAKQIELEALVGTNFHNMWVQEHDLRLALTCGKGELSFGIESTYTETSTTAVEQHLAPSAIIGRTSVDIETDELIQIGSIIKGSKGKIKAKKWIARAVELIRSVESDTTEVKVGLKYGVQENITSTTKTIKHTFSSWGKGGDYAIINDLSNICSSVRGVGAIAGGGIISPIPWISASANTRHYERTDTTYAISEALFDELQVESDDIEGALDIKVEGEADINAKNMHLNKPEDKAHEEMGSTSFSVSNKGFAESYYQEKNGRGFGFRISGSWDSDRLLGDEFNIKYKKDKDNFLDVSWVRPKVSQEELDEGDLNTLEQDLSAFDQLADDMADALPDDTEDFAKQKQKDDVVSKSITDPNYVCPSNEEYKEQCKLPDFGDGAAWGGGGPIPLTNKADKYKGYKIPLRQNSTDELNNLAQSNQLYSVTTTDKTVYTFMPYANAAANPNLTYTDLSLISETGLGLAMRYGAPALQGIIPYARGGLYTGIGLFSLKAAWDGTKELAKYVFAPDPALESFIYDSTKHLSVPYIKGKENTVKASLAATREIDLDTCHMMRDWSFLQKFQYFADKAEFWGNIYLNPRSLPWLDGTGKHRILHYQIEEYNVRCKDTSIRSEIVVLDGRIHLNGRPLSTKGASIVDGITSKENALDYWEVADFKSGILGITDEKAKKLGINMREKQFKLYDVRASNSLHGPTREFDLTSLKLKK